MSQQNQQRAQTEAPKPPTGTQDMSAFRFDDNTYFLVIDEGEEDARLTTYLLEKLPNVNPARVMSGVPIQRLSEKSSIALVVRPHVRGNRDMKSWPIAVVGPVSCEPFFEEGADSVSKSRLCEGLSKAMSLHCKAMTGRAQMPAQLYNRDEGGERGSILRMRYA
jgi:hypothetical protein